VPQGSLFSVSRRSPPAASLVELVFPLIFDGVSERQLVASLLYTRSSLFINLFRVRLARSLSYVNPMAGISLFGSRWACSLEPVKRSFVLEDPTNLHALPALWGHSCSNSQSSHKLKRSLSGVFRGSFRYRLTKLLIGLMFTFHIMFS